MKKIDLELSACLMPPKLDLLDYMALSTSLLVYPSKGTQPVRSMCAITPIAHISAGGPTFCPLIISGDIK